MPAPREAPSGTEVANELVVWGTGLGIITFALFPLVIPGVLVLVAFTIPLLIVPLAGGLVAAVIALPWLGVRALRRRAARRPRMSPSKPRGLKPAR
jgi:hypothetical protein